MTLLDAVDDRTDNDAHGAACTLAPEALVDEAGAEHEERPENTSRWLPKKWSSSGRLVA
jgi:hypothetical protein